MVYFTLLLTLHNPLSSDYYSFNGARSFGVSIQEDGKIVLGGEVFQYSGGSPLYKGLSRQSVTVAVVPNSFYFPKAIALVRYNSDGTLDNGFGTGGIVTSSFAYWYNTGRTLAIQSNGKILMGGAKSDGGRGSAMVIRYNSDGTLDTSFGTDGAVIEADQERVIKSLTIQPDGKIVAESGHLTRYNIDGSSDTGFNNGGYNSYSYRSSLCDSIVLIQNDEKMIAVGSTAWLADGVLWPAGILI